MGHYKFPCPFHVLRTPINRVQYTILSLSTVSVSVSNCTVLSNIWNADTKQNHEKSRKLLSRSQYALERCQLL